MVSISVISVFLASLVVTLTAAVTALALSYWRVAKKLARLEREQGQLKAKLQQKSLALLEKAQSDSLTLVERAHEDAVKIIDDAESLHAGMKGDLKKELQKLSHAQKQQLQKLSQELLAEHQKMLEIVKEDDIKMLSNMTHHLVMDTKQELADVRKVLIEETVNAEKILEQKVQKELEQAQRDITAYRDRKLQAIDISVTELTKQLAKELLGKSLTLEDHKDLIIKALEKARKEQIFS